MRPRWMLLQLMRKKAWALLARVSARAIVDSIGDIFGVAGEKRVRNRFCCEWSDLFF
jgi:hypothetical protein